MGDLCARPPGPSLVLLDGFFKIPRWLFDARNGLIFKARASFVVDSPLDLVFGAAHCGCRRLDLWMWLVGTAAYTEASIYRHLNLDIFT